MNDWMEYWQRPNMACLRKDQHVAFQRESMTNNLPRCLKVDKRLKHIACFKDNVQHGQDISINVDGLWENCLNLASLHKRDAVRNYRDGDKRQTFAIKTLYDDWFGGLGALFMLLLGAGTWQMNDGAHFHVSRKWEASTLLYFLRMGLILSHEINSREKRIEYERGRTEWQRKAWEISAYNQSRTVANAPSITGVNFES